MVDTRGKGSGSKSKAPARVRVEPKPLIISPEVPPDDVSCGEISKNDELKREEVMDEVVAGVVADELHGGEDCRIEGFDFLVAGNDDIGVNEANNEKSEEVIDGVIDENNVRTVEEDCGKGEEPIKSCFDGNDVSNMESSNPGLIVGVRNDDEALGAASPHGLVESATELAETVVGAEEDEVPNCSADDEDVNVNGREVQDSVVLMTGGTNDDDGGLLVSEGGPLEGVTENVENREEVNELNAEEPMSTSLNDGGVKIMHENSSIVNEVKEVAEKLSRPRKIIARKKLIKKKVPGKVGEGEGKPSDGDGSSELCKQDTSVEANTQSGSNEALAETVKRDETEDVEKGEGTAVKPLVNIGKERKRLNRKKLLGHSPVEAASNEQNPKPAEVNPNCEEDKETTQQEINSEEAEKSGKRTSRSRKWKNKLVESSQKVNVKVEEDTQKPGSSKKGKSSKKVDSMGMIFMCSSETKKDCYKYKVLGLPAAKKDIVSKIYKGMRLFLFDVNLKMLYGIYKAAAPGGYNIEPRAFKSQFPSQVKFTVMEDCLPLAEEKFKKVIKDNYYTKNKFNCELTHEQVKNLCKLFNEFTKKASSKRDSGSQRAVASSSGVRDKKRKRAEESRRVGDASSLELERSRGRRHGEVRRSPLVRVREEVHRAPLVRVHEEVRRAPVIRGHEEARHAPVIRVHEDLRLAPVIRGHEEARHAPVIRDHEDLRFAPVIRGHEEVRRLPVVIGERYHHPAVIYDRDTYLPSVDSTAALYRPLRAIDPALTRSYTYERSPGAEDAYRRDSALDYRDLQLSSSRELRYPAELRHRDPYVLYGEPRSYREQEYEPDTRLPFGGRYAEHHSSLEYRPPLPLHRRY